MTIRHALVLVALALPLAAAPVAFRLGNGLRVILPEGPEAGVFRATLRLDWDPALPAEARMDSASLLSAAAGLASSGPWAREAFLQNMADQGFRYRFLADGGGLLWEIQAPRDSASAALEHLAHAVLRPNWTLPGLEAYRLRTLEDVRASGAAIRAAQAFRRALGLPGDPPAPQAFAAWNLDTLQALHRRHVRPDRGVLVLQGVRDRGQAKELATLALGTWGGPEVPPSPAPVPQPRVFLAREAGSIPSPQLGIPVLAADPWHRSLRGLLAHVLRERREALRKPPPNGGDHPIARRTSDPWRLLLPEGPLAEGPLRLIPREGMAEAPTIAEGLGVLEGLRTAPLQAQELDRARRRWLAEWVTLRLHPREYAQIAALPALHHQEDSPLARRIEGLTLPEAQAGLHAWLDRAQIRVLGVGAAPGTAKALEALGLGSAVTETDE